MVSSFPGRSPTTDGSCRRCDVDTPARNPLRASAQRRLARRVVTSSLAFAVVVGLLVYFVQRRQMGEGVVAHALELAERFDAETGTLLDGTAGIDQAALRDEIEAFRERQRRRLFWSVAAAVAAVLSTAALIYPLLMELVRRLVRLGSDLLQANLEMLQALGGALTLRDTDTQAHSARVTLVAVRLAETLGLGPAEIRNLIKGALLHDIGKIAIGDEILLKPGPLTDEEYGAMKTHVRHGAEIVERTTWLRSGADVVRFHHEKYNGDGYPEGLAGGEIPKAARIFAIADAFDALSSRRPYKEPLALDVTLAALRRSRGSHFDPEILDAFEAIAPALFERVARREPEALSADLQTVVRRYFAVGLEGLVEA